MPPMIDTHLDLSWNALSWDRDLTWPLADIRAAEAGMTDSAARGRGTVCLEELRRGQVAVCLGTLLVRSLPWAKRRRSSDGGAVTKEAGNVGPRRLDLDFNTQPIAYATARGQLAYYEWLASQGHIRILRTRRDLQSHWEQWTGKNTTGESCPLGLIIAMEGGDPIVCPEQLDHWWELGLRSLGPVHYGRSAYAVGTGDDGPLTPAGRKLVKAMDRLGMVLDVTHLSDTSMAEALDLFGGTVIASHHNCRALVNRDRQLSDEQIRRLVDRGVVIGSALDAWMLDPNWKVGRSTPDAVTLETVADHIDHVCQIAGNARHSAIGSDLDGGFGTEQSPSDLDTIADLQKLAPILSGRGYSDDDVAGIFAGNWLRVFLAGLPG